MKRSILTASVALIALAALPAQASSPVQAGSWGQAWGDDDQPTPMPSSAVQQPRRATPPVATPAPISPSSATVQPLPALAPAQSAPGGWGDAWGDDAPTPQAPLPRARTTATPSMPPLQAPLPKALAPVPDRPAARASTTLPLDMGGWGQAWGDDEPQSAPTPKAQTRQRQAPTAAKGSPPPSDAMGMDPAPPDQDASARKPILLSADQMTHDRELGSVLAKGRVEVSQDGHTLRADRLTYDQRQDVVAASGNVIAVEPNGEVLFSDYVQLTGDMKDGVTQAIKVILADNSQMTAAKAVRSLGDRTEYSDVTYTACSPCTNQPGKRPLWQIKAEQAVHNQQDQTVEYKDAWLELAGMPIAYTPYLSHPDPTLRRKSGFLAPTAGMSSALGPNVTIPYFWAIKDNQDLTFTTRFLMPKSNLTGENLQDSESVLKYMVLSGDHRWRGSQGESRTHASLTADRHTGELRGHVDAEGKFDLNSTWRTGYQVQRASDGTYNSVYRFPINSNRPWLTTRPYLEGFGRYNYALAEAYSFQGLRSTDKDTDAPYVLPHVTYNMLNRPDSKGGQYSWNSDILAYGRSFGVGAERVSSTVGWQRPYYGSWGDITTLSTSLRGDAYHADQVPLVGSANTGRAIPQMSMNWAMPFVRTGQTASHVIEPVSMVAVSPNGQNPDKIPNEDSLGFELDESNVLNPNRMPGLDRVEGGLRGGYGLRWRMFPYWGGSYGAALAQGWRTHSDSIFRQDSGFTEQLSDYVGRVDATPSPNLSLRNRFRLDRSSGALRRNESSVIVGSPLLRVTTSYLMMERQGTETDALSRRHYAAVGVRSALTKDWSVSTNAAYNLVDGAEPLSWQARLLYDDDCFAFVSTVQQNFFHDRDMSNSFDVMFHLVFKTLADIPVNMF